MAVEVENKGASCCGRALIGTTFCLSLAAARLCNRGEMPAQISSNPRQAASVIGLCPALLQVAL